MRERTRPDKDARASENWPGSGAGECGTTLLDVVVATVLLLVILLPAAQLLVTSGRVVGGSKVQAVAQHAALSQLETDRAAFLASPGSQPFTASSCAGSTYGPTTTNSTYGQYLTACAALSGGGAPYWVFQSGGWCVANGTTLGSGSSGTPIYWVSVMVAWGGRRVPAPTTVVAASSRVVLTSALQTPAGFAPPSPPWSCPL
jgi:Tfp pilus assembly protein PilV